MRIVFVHPNYHSGGAEIAGNWPPAWVAYLAGHLKTAGFDDIHFIDAMTHHVDHDALRVRLAELQPDLVGCTSITPSIYEAEEVLRIASEVVPNAVRVLGGVHATFMFRQVLSEAPWIDVIVRGEGEEIMTALAEAVRDGRWPADRRRIKGLAFREGEEIVATPAASTVKDLEAIKPDWSILDWDKYIYIPLGVKVAIPNMARGCPFTCSFCSQWKFWRDYRVRDPKKVADEIEDLVTNHGVGFFILADEEPTINKKKFVEFCQEMIDRGLNKRVKWGINTRVTDIYRDRDLLKFYREAGLVHISLGTEAAAQLKLDLFNKETTVAQNKEAIRLLRREFGNEVAIIGKTMGPWSLAYHTFGVETFLLMSLDSPSDTKYCLDQLKRVTIEFGLAQMEAGADALTLPDHATGDLVSADYYARYLKDMHHEFAESIPVPLILHICGRTVDRMPFIAETGMAAFHFDSKNTPAESIAAVNGKISLVGNINNPETLFSKSPEDVRREVYANLDAGVQLVGPECAIPLQTTIENLKEIPLAVKDWHREHAQRN